MFQHQFGVVAAGFGLDHGGDAGRGQPGQQHRGLDLRRRHRRAVEDRQRIARAVQRQRQPAALAAGADPARPSIPADRASAASAAAQRGVAIEDRRDRAAGNGAHHQPAAGAGIAEIERLLGLRRSRRRRRRAPTRRNRPVRSTLAPSARMALAVLRTSSPSSRPEIRVSPTASAPKIRARCEIDLSPGTRTLPVRGRSNGLQAASAERRGAARYLNGSRLCPLRWRQVSHGARRVTRRSGLPQSAIDSGAQLAK